MAHIELQTGDDWEVLKVDGVTKYSGHAIRAFQFLELIKELGHTVIDHYGEFVDDDEDDFRPS